MGRLMLVTFAASVERSRRAVAGETFGATESVLLQAAANTAVAARMPRKMMERMGILFVVWGDSMCANRSTPVRAAGGHPSGRIMFPIFVTRARPASWPVGK